MQQVIPTASPRTTTVNSSSMERAAAAETDSEIERKRQRIVRARKAYHSLCRTFLRPDDQFEPAETGDGNHTFRPFLSEPSLEAKVQRLTAHLAGEHEKHLDLARRPHQRGIHDT